MKNEKFLSWYIGYNIFFILFQMIFTKNKRKWCFAVWKHVWNLIALPSWSLHLCWLRISPQYYLLISERLGRHWQNFWEMRACFGKMFSCRINIILVWSQYCCIFLMQIYNPQNNKVIMNLHRLQVIESLTVWRKRLLTNYVLDWWIFFLGFFKSITRSLWLLLLTKLLWTSY